MCAVYGAGGEHERPGAERRQCCSYGGVIGLDSLRRVLWSPNVWGRPHMAQLRGQEWPEVKAAQGLEEQLVQLREISQSCFTAGGRPDRLVPRVMSG